MCGSPPRSNPFHSPFFPFPRSLYLIHLSWCDKDRSFRLSNWQIAPLYSRSARSRSVSLHSCSFVVFEGEEDETER